MELYIPRKIMFKAWNKDSKLLMRLDSISCVRGELVKKDHILLQFTEMVDKHREDLYEMDVVLKGSEKFVIQWSTKKHTWCYQPLNGSGPLELLTDEVAKGVVRLCSYFESIEIS